MATEKVLCKNDSCTNRILPATAARTGGYCMPCVNARERQKRQRHIEANRRDVDLFSGVTDPVEIIRLHHVDRERDPLVRYVPYHGSYEALYRNLSESEQSKLVEICIERADTGDFKLLDSICLCLAAFCEPDFSELFRYLLDKGYMYPAMLFRSADQTVVDELVSRLDWDKSNRSSILLALAWSGASKTASQFGQWIESPPQWADDLYLPVHEYTRDAGWEVLDTGPRRLHLESCFALTTDASPDEVLKVCSPEAELCGWCQQPLTTFIEVDLRDPRFSFIPAHGQSLKLSSCEVCACYADAVFIEQSSDGQIRWSQHNGEAPWLPDSNEQWERMPNSCLAMEPEPRSVHYAANEFLPTSFSQLGGLPTWIQDFAYPVCPGCGTTMVFIAQISCEDFDNYGEGVYYLYHCFACLISAANYQQT